MTTNPTKPQTAGQAKLAEQAARNLGNSTDAYAAARLDVAILIDLVGLELDARDEDAPRPTWDKVGTMQSVRDRLIELLEFVSPHPRETIEEHLISMRGQD